MVGDRRAACVVGAAAVAVVGSYLAVRTGGGDRVDRVAAARLGRPRGGTADRVVAAATDLGSVYGLTGCAAALTVAGRRRAAMDLTGAGLVAWGLAQGAKPLLQRPRPYEVVAADGSTAGHLRIVSIPAGSSWPSGHAAVAAAMATALGPHTSRAGRGALTVAAAGVGASRLYVGVHHLTDVVAGAGVGVLSAALSRMLRPG